MNPPYLDFRICVVVVVYSGVEFDETQGASRGTIVGFCRGARRITVQRWSSKRDKPCGVDRSMAPASTACRSERLNRSSSKRRASFAKHDKHLA